MPGERRARQLAMAFERVYPKTLPERLAWWCRVLGVDRRRLLRMMGMSESEIKRQKNKSWETILEMDEWQDKGWWVEGKLHELLALFDYDWKALAARLHQTAQANGAKFSRRTRPWEGVPKGQAAPGGTGVETLLNELDRGGSESSSALIAYLSSDFAAGNRSP
jgi:hypothetical protein